MPATIDRPPKQDQPSSDHERLEAIEERTTMTETREGLAIAVKRGEKIRMHVMNAGPSIWSAFHVIGTVFDKAVVEGQAGHDAQTANLAPSQGGWVEFTLDAEGNYPFVTHGFGDMVKGAVGVLATENAPKGGAAKH